jgi:hypothetical protein
MPLPFLGPFSSKKTFRKQEHAKRKKNMGLRRFLSADLVALVEAYAYELRGQLHNCVSLPAATCGAVRGEEIVCAHLDGRIMAWTERGESQLLFQCGFAPVDRLVANVYGVVCASDNYGNPALTIWRNGGFRVVFLDDVAQEVMLFENFCLARLLDGTVVQIARHESTATAFPGVWNSLWPLPDQQLLLAGEHGDVLCLQRWDAGTLDWRSQNFRRSELDVLEGRVYLAAQGYIHCYSSMFQHLWACTMPFQEVKDVRALAHGLLIEADEILLRPHDKEEWVRPGVARSTRAGPRPVSRHCCFEHFGTDELLVFGGGLKDRLEVWNEKGLRVVCRKKRQKKRRAADTPLEILPVSCGSVAILRATNLEFWR